jgi:hypothetical protein
MKAIRVYMASLILVSLAHLALGQSTESLSMAGSDMLKAAHVYPNPAVDYLHLKFDQPIAREVTLELHSIIGNLLEVEKEVVDDYEVRVRVKDFPAGYYLLDVKKPGVNHVAFKFLKR